MTGVGPAVSPGREAWTPWISGRLPILEDQGGNPREHPGVVGDEDGPKPNRLRREQQVVGTDRLGVGPQRLQVEADRRIVLGI